jgi:hypothetical protein
MNDIFMKRHTRFFLGAALVLLFSANGFAQMFEGVITMEITSPKMKKSMTLITSMKGDKSMAEMQMPQGSMKIYTDQASGKITTVMESMKMGMEMDMNVMAKSVSKDDPPKVEATGEKKIISGHSCELYRLTAHDNKQSNWWMTGDLPRSILNSLREIYKNSKGSLPGGNAGTGAVAIEKMFQKGLAPIEIDMLKDGKAESSITFIKYEQKHIDDSIFVIASDIKIQPMPAKGGGQ